MQDWAYAWYGIFEVTIELSLSDWPSPLQLPTFWSDNQESMLSYLERVREGVRGLVTDADTGASVTATVLLDSDPFPTYTDPDLGDYHRVVLPGTYSMTVSAPGYVSRTIPITVAAGPAARFDVALQPLVTDLQAVAHRVLDGAAGDGTLEPGETADLVVTLQNLGRAASRVGARLVSTGWYADVLRTRASYPDLATGASAESEAPFYEVTVDPDVPLGHRLGFALRWTAAEGSGTSEPFFLDVGGTTCATHTATDLPQSILDNTTTTSQLSVADDGVIDQVQVTVDIIHTYIGDLTLTLNSAQGTPVVLHAGGGGSSDDIQGTYPLSLVPANSLDVLAGEPAAGSWKLVVHDRATGDTGTFKDWGLTVCPIETTTPEMRLRDLAREADGVHLSWWSYPGLSSYRVYRSTDPSSAAAFVDVTSLDGDDTDTFFLDTSTESTVFYLVTGLGPQGEGPKGHFDQ
jgi:subtilisin-like proprotein convertase family protein